MPASLILSKDFFEFAVPHMQGGVMRLERGYRGEIQYRAFIDVHLSEVRAKTSVPQPEYICEEPRCLVVIEQ
jgi:hypothetical protein